MFAEASFLNHNFHIHVRFSASAANNLTINKPLQVNNRELIKPSHNMVCCLQLIGRAGRYLVGTGCRSWLEAGGVRVVLWCPSWPLPLAF